MIHYPYFYHTLGRYAYIKQLNDCEFIYITWDEKGLLTRGRIQTNFPENLRAILKIDRAKLISGEQYRAMESKYHEQETKLSGRSAINDYPDHDHGTRHRTHPESAH